MIMIEPSSVGMATRFFWCGVANGFVFGESRYANVDAISRDADSK